MAVLNALRHPYFIQNRLRNMFEIGFADFERGTQQDRFRALEDTWPGLIDRAFPIRFLPEPSGAPVGTVREYALGDLYELCLAELSLYFQQDRRRIARCENCWRYFVPKNRGGVPVLLRGEWMGSPASRRGPSVCAGSGRIRTRRWRPTSVCAGGWRSGPTGWSWLVREGKTTCSPSAEHSTRRGWTGRGRQRRNIRRAASPPRNSCGGSTWTGKWAPAKPPGIRSPSRIGRPGGTYIKQRYGLRSRQAVLVNMLHLDLSADNPAWTVITAEEQIRKARGGHASLHDRYGVEDPVDPKAHAKELEEMFAPHELSPEEKALAQMLREAVRISMETVWPEGDDV